MSYLLLVSAFFFYILHCSVSTTRLLPVSTNSSHATVFKQQHRLCYQKMWKNRGFPRKMIYKWWEKPQRWSRYQAFSFMKSQIWHNFDRWVPQAFLVVWPFCWPRDRSCHCFAVIVRSSYLKQRKDDVTWLPSWHRPFIQCSYEALS